LTDTYYPVEIARGTGLAATAKIRGGAVRLLAGLGHAGARAQEDVVARMPSDSERTALSLKAGEPVLELTRLTLGADDRPIQVDVRVMPPRGQRLRYEIRIGRLCTGDLPVLRILRVVFSDDDRPIEATVMVKARDLYEVRRPDGGTRPPGPEQAEGQS